jgi:hypothetical protein
VQAITDLAGATYIGIGAYLATLGCALAQICGLAALTTMPECAALAPWAELAAEALGGGSARGVAGTRLTSTCSADNGKLPLSIQKHFISIDLGDLTSEQQAIVRGYIAPLAPQVFILE